MNKNEFNQFQEEWDAAMEASANGKILSPKVMSMIFEDFEPYSLHTIINALAHHRRICKYAPTVADITAIITPELPNPHIGADEAWALAKLAMDNNNSVVVTPEILQAMDIASEVFNQRDENPARMAFRDAYTRIVRESPEKPAWFVSAGNDKSLTECVVRDAIRLGRLAVGSADKYALDAPTTTVQALIEGYVGRVDIKKEKMVEIKNLLANHEKPKPKKIQLTEDEYSSLPWYLRETGWSA